MADVRIGSGGDPDEEIVKVENDDSRYRSEFDTVRKRLTLQRGEYLRSLPEIPKERGEGSAIF